MFAALEEDGRKWVLLCCDDEVGDAMGLESGVIGAEAESG